MNKNQAFSLLMATWPRRDDEPPIQHLIKAYEIACQYCDPQYIEQSVMAFVQGRATGHNMAFRPTPAQIAERTNKAQAESDRINEISKRVIGQTHQIEYQKAPKQIRTEQVSIWDRIKAEIRKPNIAELADVYMRERISTPGTVFDVKGAWFPDGTHHSIEEMRQRTRGMADKRNRHFGRWETNPQRWNDKSELAASIERINAAMPGNSTAITEDEL